MPLIDWKHSHEPISYELALKTMEDRVHAIQYDKAPECVWFLEHPPMFSYGTSAKKEDLLDKNRLPVFKSGRGGQYTYHGPGQRIIYLMLNLRQRHAMDIRQYIYLLEAMVIDALRSCNIKGERRNGRVGIWVQKSGKDYKIAAIGVRVRKWITYHGVAVNITPDLSFYESIIPCGIREHGITSMQELGVDIAYDAFDRLLKQSIVKYLANMSKETSRN